VWLLRAFGQLLFHVAIAVVAALGIGAVLALVHGGGFGHAFAIACFCIGALLLLMGAGGHTTATRVLETGGRMPGMPATFRSQPGETTLSVAAVFFITAAVLFVLGAVLV
jgi:hypothetical protein